MGTPGYFLILPCYMMSEFGLDIVYWSHRQTVIRVCPPALSVTTESSKRVCNNTEAAAYNQFLPILVLFTHDDRMIM